MMKWVIGTILAVFMIVWAAGMGCQTEGNRPFKTVGDTSLEALDVRIHSKHVILVDLTDKRILITKRESELAYPASLTKIMTAVVAIENIGDPYGLVTIDKGVLRGLYETGASMAGFQPGERVKAIDLLYALMLPSGADASVALARHTAGTEEAFVGMMNDAARRLGMVDTRFTNTVGLHDPGHRTTAYDMAVLLEYALRNPLFRRVFTSDRHSTAATNRHPDGITFVSTLSTKLGGASLRNGRILGGKTGYTEQAGLCLASLASIEGREYALVTLGAPGNHRTPQYNIIDALTVYGYSPPGPTQTSVRSSRSSRTSMSLRTRR